MSRAAAFGFYPVLFMGTVFRKKSYCCPNFCRENPVIFLLYRSLCGLSSQFNKEKGKARLKLCLVLVYTQKAMVFS